jgi:hypothetical protein
MAVKFLNIGDRGRDFVQKYIRQELMDGIAPLPAAGHRDQAGTSLPERKGGMPASPPALPD